MDVRIKTTGYQMTTEVESYLDGRMQTIEKHIGDEAQRMRAEVEIGKAAGHSKHGENWFAEVQIIRPGEPVVRVSGTAETVNAAIDMAKDELLQVLRKDKTRRSSQVRKIGAKVKSWLRSGK